MSINDNIGSFLDNDKVAFKSSTVEFCGVGSREPQDIAIQVTSIAMTICQPTASASLPMHRPDPKGRGI